MLFFNPEKAANIALKLFSSPRAGRARDFQRDYLEEHIKGYIISDSIKLCYYNWPGTGDRILLVHGWESNSSRWKPYIADMVDRNYDIYALDAPSHGLSEGKYFNPQKYADGVAQLVEKYNINILLGHSVGAYTSLIYAQREDRNESINQLMLLAPTGKLQYVIDQFFNILGLNKKMREAYNDNFKKIFHFEPHQFDSDKLIKGIGLNGFLMHDKNDRTLPFKDSVLIADNWPQAKFVITEGYGHRLKSSEVKEELFKYLDETSAQRTGN